MVFVPKRSITTKQYIYGDFDGDGTKNIDDPRPFDPKVSQYPDQKKHLDYYDRARYGGGEVKLSTELRAVERYNNARAPLLDKFKRENPGAVGRIKTVPSTLKKLRERGISGIGDVAGAAIYTKDRAEATKTYSTVKKRYAYDKASSDDFYKNPKGGVYRAYHTSIVDPKNRSVKVEVQVKSKKNSELHARMHEAYKYGKPLSGFKKESDELYRRGY